MLLPSLFVMAEIEEDTTFQPSHEGTDYPVGTEDFQINFGFETKAYRLLYPAMTEGDGAEMAGNGPFPWVLFWGDYNEIRSGYNLFSSALVQRGYIVLVAPEPADIQDIDDSIMEAEALASIMVEQNETGELIVGSIGNIDAQHWAIGGHGKGALVGYGVYPYWKHTEVNETIQPPRALFGLAIDNEDWVESKDWFELTENSQAEIPKPTTALFITGTVDSIAPSAEHRDWVQSNGRIAWHWMHILGADHYQFQDSTSIFETDNNPGITQEEQISISANHVVAYLDATLRADVERFQVAFNREESRDTPADASAYISEDMMRSSFIRLDQSSTQPRNTTQLEGWDNLTMMSNVSLRDGRNLSEIPSEWEVDVECGWLDSTELGFGTVHDNSSVSCTLPMMNISPGEHISYLRVYVNKTPGVAFFEVQRTNTPLELNQPLVEFRVPQRGEISVDTSAIATDPDGQTVRAIFANVEGNDSSHFSIDIEDNGLTITVTHIIDEEWVGEANANVTLQADGVYIDQRQFLLRILLVPVDDPVVLQSTIPQQRLVEDGDMISVNLTDIVTDPEGEEILGLIKGTPAGATEFVEYSIEDGVLYLTPLPDKFGAEIIPLLLGDGSNPGIAVDLPIRIDPVDDPPIINFAAWEDVELTEDEQLVVDLTPFAYDIDGDMLVWTFDINSTNVVVTLENTSLIFSPSEDANGDAGMLNLQVSDGTTSYQDNLTISIADVPDAPVISIQSSTLLDDTSATIQWVVTDADGLPRQEVDIFINNEEMINLTHSCLISNEITISCVSMLPLPFSEDKTYGVEVKYLDEELQSYVVASLVLDGGEVNQTTVPTNAEETSNALPVEMVGFVVGACIVLAGIVRLFLGRESQSPPSVEEPKETPRGLLARAEQKK